MTNKDRVVAFGPASVGNTGPCYDVLGYALNDVGDFVELEKVEAAEDFLVWNDELQGPGATHLEGLPYTENSAWVAASQVLDRCLTARPQDFSLRLTLHKYLPVGSGIGSSAASAVAAVRALIEMLNLDPEPSQIIEALEVAEEATAETGYPDNVVPSYFGGLYLINENDPRDGYPNGGKRYHKITGGGTMVSVVVRPAVTVTTRDGREAVRDYVYRKYIDPEFIDPDPGQAAISILDLIRTQSAKAAEIVWSYTTGDVARLGAIMRDNPLLEGARSRLIPEFHEVKKAAMAAGAHGCTISGAGPAVVAVTDTWQLAGKIRDAMRSAFGELRTQWLISEVNQSGATIIDSVEKFISEAGRSNNFYAETTP